MWAGDKLTYCANEADEPRRMGTGLPILQYEPVSLTDGQGLALHAPQKRQLCSKCIRAAQIS